VKSRAGAGYWDRVSASAQPQSDNSNGNPLLLLVFKTALGFGRPRLWRNKKKQKEAGF
jgi:hypothetical protein